jgi:hypothetical protein
VCKDRKKLSDRVAECGRIVDYLAEIAFLLSFLLSEAH